MAPVGVLVMAHGTPASTAEIEPFYTRIRRGRPPTPEQLADLQRRYTAIGGLSPLTERTRAQVDALRAVLDERAPRHYVVRFGAKHAHPLIEEGAGALGDDGADPVLGLVLTPHASSLGSGEYLERARAAVTPAHAFVDVGPFYARPEFVTLMASRVNDALGELTVDPSRVAVVFTAHSLPARVREIGDPYPEQVASSAQLVAESAGLARWFVAWQSAGRTPEPWLAPDVRDEIRRLAETGDFDHVLVCPIGFVSDHLEVLYDLDVEATASAADVGIGFSRTASLNHDPRFVAVLADAVVDAAPPPS